MMVIIHSHPFAGFGRKRTPEQKLWEHCDTLMNELVVDHELLAFLKTNGVLTEEMMETIQVFFNLQSRAVSSCFLLLMSGVEM